MGGPSAVRAKAPGCKPYFTAHYSPLFDATQEKLSADTMAIADPWTGTSDGDNAFHGLCWRGHLNNGLSVARVFGVVSFAAVPPKR